MKKNKILFEKSKNYNKKYKDFEKAIKQYNRIAIFRHSHPDYDALGSQLSIYSFLKDNFPSKDVVCVGDDHVTLTPKCFRKMDIVNDSWFEQDFLAIVVDCSQQDRISDERYKKAKCIIKIDHHPEVDKYGNIQIVDISMSAAGELVANILFSLIGKYIISKECASQMYKAIVGDSGRFLYESTTVHTFEISKLLLEVGIDISEIYSQMYDQELSDLKFTAWVLKNYKITKHGIAYYILTDKDLKELNIPATRGKDNVNLFAHFNGIPAWLSCTQDVEKNEWRVSLRSAKKPIEEIATKYNGGGHAQASGCKLKSLAEFNNLLEDLDEYFK